jgi:ParB family transcriptional regulator, chromosome partitioning protein
MAISKKQKGLGRGLEALLGPDLGPSHNPFGLAGSSAGRDSALRGDGSPSTLKVSQLRAGKYQPRTRMDEGSLYELAQSIKSQGVMQPILVRCVDGGAGQYEIIAGERRFRAAQLAGLDEVPVLVKDVPDEAAAVMALIENIQREDLNPLEEAQGLKRLVDEFQLTHEQAAQAVGRSRSAASNLLRLLNLSDPVQKMLMAGDLDMGHARALLALDGAEQILVANQVVARKLNVRETEKLVHHPAAGDGTPAGRALAGGGAKRGAASKSRDVQALEEQLADHLAATVDIRIKGASKSGELVIAFHSFDALDGVLQRMGLSR